MRKFSIKYKIVALALALAFVFQTMESINSHTYSTGISTFHKNHIKGIISCFGQSYHAIYNCGMPNHIGIYYFLE